MDRKQILTALDSLDDATHHLQTAFVACGDPELLDLLPQVYALYDEYLDALPRAVEQPELPM